MDNAKEYARSEEVVRFRLKHTPRFRAAFVAYEALLLIDALVAVLSLAYVDLRLASRYGMPLVWRAL